MRASASSDPNPSAVKALLATKSHKVSIPFERTQVKKFGPV